MKSLEHWKNSDITCTHPCEYTSCLQSLRNEKNHEIHQRYADVYGTHDCPRWGGVRERKARVNV